MDDDDQFFSAPLADSSGDDAPIVLGPPSDDLFGGGGDYGDFAQPPMDNSGSDGAAAFLGDINESPSGDAPIVLQPVEDGSGAEAAAAALVPTGPTPMQVWNDEWQELLKQRKDEETARKAELLEESRVALEEFLREREQKREGGMAKNREDEQVKLEAIEADLENDNSWQRVCKLVELQHDSTETAQDIKRMRDVMILLKNEPAKAEALSV
jgi:Clathrin light chain